MPEKMKAATSDSDGTLIRTSKTETFTFRMADQGLIPHEPLRRSRELRRRWVRRDGTFDEYIVELARCLDQGLLRGVHLTDALRVADEIIEEQWEHTYVFTRELQKAMLTAGYATFMVSLSPSFLVKRFAERHGFTDYAATELEVDEEGLLTGNRLLPNKVDAVQRLLEIHGCTLRDSLSIGDTGSDGKMLKLADQPFAINPDQHLDDLAREAAMTVITERKNVIRLAKTSHPGGRFHEVSIKEAFEPVLADGLYARMEIIKQKIL